MQRVVTLQNRFEVLSEDTDVVPAQEDELHLAATWFDISRTDSDQGAEGSAGDLCSVPWDIVQCQLLPMQVSEAGSQMCAAFVTDDRSATTRVRDRAPDRVSQATTMVASIRTPVPVRI